MRQPALFEKETTGFYTLKEAAAWASQYLQRNVTVSNISYLIQYGRIKKYGSNTNLLVSLEELEGYYNSFNIENRWKEKLGKDLNWSLSFDEYTESERTKHVHRLHPYKGKFIPQLVEYFLDSHTDDFKKNVFFSEGDIVLDPFCGSGTTLVQSNELGMHSIGIDISAFNALISNVKIDKYDLHQIKKTVQKISNNLDDFQKHKTNIAFETHLLADLAQFNSKHFPSPEYRRKINKNELNEADYSKDKESEFLIIYNELIKKYDLKIDQEKDDTFLDKWFLLPVREEIDFLNDELKKSEDIHIRRILSIILSRTVRSCRATTHADLATLKEPVKATYYCKKHGKICKPIFSVKGWWERYSTDTLVRLRQFDRLRSDTYHICLTGDSRQLDILSEVRKHIPKFADLIEKVKIKGVFTSPPYVGLIDYHEQHAYSYELFGFERKDEKEIGPLSAGQNKEARDAYSIGIAETLKNCRKYLQEDFDIFLVANDKYDLYPEIADMAKMKIVNRFERPVLCRVEKDRSNAYSETIFHLKEK
ncbi:MAG: DNA methyltransferase [bacterium]